VTLLKPCYLVLQVPYLPDCSWQTALCPSCCQTSYTGAI